ncbi:hypothetical protein SEA_KNOCKER_44 [Mycobacterium phage Knocker]|nr:hypothetical protein SEA_KNOCKER_44 [Mycobacterium phage Knocker]
MMTTRRVDPWHPPVTPAAFQIPGIVLLVGTFFPTVDQPGVTAAAGAGLVGIGCWLRHRASQPPRNSATARTAERPTVLWPPA